MPKLQMPKLAMAAVILGGTLIGTPAFAQDQQAGVSAAVRGSVQVARAGAVGRQVESAEPIYLRDAITSGNRSGMQIILMDESVFTIGPGSELEIDEFVYDPGEGTGSLAANMTKGVMRFVTGKIAAGTPENMTIKLPVGTIGIRGTVGIVQVLTPEEAQAKFPEESGKLLSGGGGQAGAPVVFAALVGPGPNNNVGSGVGSFNLSTPNGAVNLNRIGSAALATPGAPPVFFIAPPGAIQAASGSLTAQPEEGEDDQGGTGEDQTGQDGQGEQAAEGEDGGQQGDGQGGGGLQAASGASGQGIGESFRSAVSLGGVVSDAGSNDSLVGDVATSGSITDFTFADVLAAAGGTSSVSISNIELSGSISGKFNSFVSFSNRTFDIQFFNLSGDGVDDTQFQIANGNVSFAAEDPAAIFVSNLRDVDGFLNAGANTGTSQCTTCEARVIYTGGNTASVEIFVESTGASGTATANY